MTIKVGDYIKCNDKRYGWTVRVQDVEYGLGQSWAIIHPKAGGRTVKVRLDRIHEDGKTRAQGYNKVAELGPEIHGFTIGQKVKRKDPRYGIGGGEMEGTVCRPLEKINGGHSVSNCVVQWTDGHVRGVFPAYLVAA